MKDRTLAQSAGLTEKHRKQLHAAVGQLRDSLRVAQATAKCGVECSELLADIHSGLDQATTLLREFWGEEPE